MIDAVAEFATEPVSLLDTIAPLARVAALRVRAPAPTHAPQSQEEQLKAALSEAKARANEARRARDLATTTEDEQRAQSFLDVATADVNAADEDLDAFEQAQRQRKMFAGIATPTIAETVAANPAMAARVAEAVPLPGYTKKPSIFVGPDLDRLADEAEAAIATLGKIYVRGRSLVHVVHDRSGADFVRRPEGSPVIAELGSARLRELLSTAATWVKTRKAGGTKVHVPPEVVATIEDRGQWPRFPAIEGIAECPVFRADGTILDVPGYDARTRLLYDPCGTAFPPVNTAPSRDEAASAARFVLEPFSEFPFVADCDKAAVLALILSLVGRAAIDGQVPMFGARAPTPGSGKGLVIDTVAVLATGRIAPKMANTTDDEETRKRLLALALDASAMIMIDNVEGEIGSPALAMALTAGEISDRVLGASRRVTASLRSVWCYSGNNVAHKGDLGRRVVPIDLDPRVEHPEDRTFARADLLAYVREQRPQLVCAALTVLRGYVAAGRPSHGLPAKGSFEAWDSLVRGAVIWAYGVDPLAGTARIREQGDADLDNLSALLSAWLAMFADRAVTAREAIESAGAGLLGSPGGVDDPRGVLRAALTPYAATRTGQLDVQLLGRALQRLKNRPACGLRFEPVKKNERGVPYRAVSLTT